MRSVSIKFQFALAAALFSVSMPLSIALAREKQFVQESVTSLMSELNSRVVVWDDAGRIVHGHGADFTIFNSDGSLIEFTNVVHGASSVSGLISMYDSDSMLTDSFFIHDSTLVGQNRIDFEASSNGILTTGTITGMGNYAIADVSRDGENELYRVNYSRQGSDSLVVAYALKGVSGGIRSPAAGAAVIVVVVLFVAITCLLLGWWGCTIWTPARDRYRLA